MKPSHLRLTKIICTIGPACQDAQILANMANKGMVIARLNMSHGNRETQLAMINSIRELNKTCTFPVAIMVDTRGAEIRTGDVVDPIHITKGQEVIFTSVADPREENGRTIIHINYDGFSHDIREIDRILLDNGELSFDILGVEQNGVVAARARENGKIGSRRHVNLPGADIDLPSITERDWEDIQFSIEQNVDFIALSFIRNAEEVTSVRDFLKKHGSTVGLIAKIETRKGVKNIGEILEVSDGIMVARGDLGADVPFEELPVIQDEIVLRCRDAGKPVIVATQMLESMIYHPMPTRAEVTDTAYAVITGTDTTMLSGETAGGIDPVNVVDAMARIQFVTEQHIARFGKAFETKLTSKLEEYVDKLVAEALDDKIVAFVALTNNGEAPRILSKFRSLPVIAFSSDPQLLRKMEIHYGVFPVLAEEKDVKKLLKEATKKDLLSYGDRVMIIDDTFENHSVEKVS